MMNIRRMKSFCPWMLLGTFALMSWIFSGEGWAASHDDTLRLLFWQAPTMLNPHLTGSFKDLNAARICYEPLASFDRDGVLIPFLAAEIPSRENGGVAADGKSVTWKLKQDVTWADGRPFTADDVLFTYEFVMNPENKAVSISMYSHIERIDVVDDFSITIRFKEVTPFWPDFFVGQNGMILPRHIFSVSEPPTSPGADANLFAIGTGPYYVVEYKKEDMLIIGDDMVNIIRIVYEPNPYFRDDRPPHFTRVELLGGGDVSTAAQAVFVDGSGDFVWNMQMEPAMLQNLEQSEKGRMVSVSGPLVERILVNFSDPNRETETGERSSLQFPHPFFSDKRVRQALAHAIDRDAIGALYGDSAQPTTNLLVSPPQYASPNTAHRYPFDLERAAELLDAAGWNDADGDGIREKDGVKLSLVFQTAVNPIRQHTQEIIKQALETLGFDVTLKLIDASVFFSANPENSNSLWHFYADLEEYYTGSWSPDPSSHWQNLKCDRIPQQANELKGGGNIGRWCSRAYEALYDRAAAELDPEKRAQLFIAINDMVVEEVVLIPLVRRIDVHGVSRSLDEIELTPWDASTWKIQDWTRREE